jgi:uncharacterized membrane protein YciS (DUF1049 family)
MQRFSALVRYIFTVILISILVAVAAHFIEEQPQETANVVLKFLFDLWEQTWFRITALLLVGFVAGLWVDWLLRKLDGSHANQRETLGTEMHLLVHGRLDLFGARPEIDSCFIAARKLGYGPPISTYSRCT